MYHWHGSISYGVIFKNGENLMRQSLSDEVKRSRAPEDVAACLIFRIITENLRKSHVDQSHVRDWSGSWIVADDYRNEAWDNPRKMTARVAA